MQTEIGRQDKQIFKAILPSIVLNLVREKKIVEAHLSSPKKLLERFVQFEQSDIQNTKLYLSDLSFYKNSLKAWKKGDRRVGIVLFATAVEQVLNESYRFMLEDRGLKTDEITKIIKSNTLDAKTSWLFTLIAGRKFPSAIAKRLRLIADTRNSIVHYKAEPSIIDQGGGSYDRIKEALDAFKGVQLSAFYVTLVEFLDETTLKISPQHNLAMRATSLIYKEWIANYQTLQLRRIVEKVIQQRTTNSQSSS